jgi:hypothetical protein
MILTILLTGCGDAVSDFKRGFEDAGSVRYEDEGEGEALPSDKWTYIEVDSTKAMWGDFDDPDWLRYFGLAAGDLNGDGLLDLVSGRNAYLNPGGDMQGEWEKLDLGRNVDANLIIEQEGKPAILGEALPDVVLFTGSDDGSDWTKSEVVAQVPATGHHNGQGYKVADLLPGNGTDEIIYASLGGLFVMDPSGEKPWPVTLVGKDASDEGFGAADVDGDGDIDLISGFRAEGGDPEVPTVVVWFENPGTLTEDWTRHEVGTTQFATDRVEAADLNGDGMTDVVIAEERYPGLEPDASLYVYFQEEDGWRREKVVTQYSMNNLALTDMDRDGDVDILTAEHKGPDLSLQLWKNDGSGRFTESELDRGKESHLGTQPYDMDGDGDLDIVSIGWDQHKYVHLWRNDAIGTK